MPSVATTTICDVARPSESSWRTRLEHSPIRKATSGYDQPSLSPILGIPVDVLGEIFTHACSRQPAPANFPIIDPADPLAPTFNFTPLILGQVCRHWRSVALHMATLWSIISVYSPMKRHVHFVELWLARSGQRCPLTLTLHQADHYPFNPSISDLVASEANWTRRILHMFIKHVHRWKKIDFSFSDGLPYRSLADLPIGSAPNLEVATFDLQYWSKRSISKLWASINSSPALRQVSWVDLSTPPPSTPWSQLSNVTLHGMRFDAVLSMLPLCLSLQTLHVVDPTNYSPTLIASHTTPIPLPFIKTLSIASNSFDTGVFLDHLEAPSLTHFIVHHGVPSGLPIDTNSLHRLLSRSRCTLKSLDVYSGNLNETDLLSYISSPHLNGVTKFLLDRRKLDSFIRNLVVKPEPKPTLYPFSALQGSHKAVHHIPPSSPPCPPPAAPVTLLFPKLVDLTLTGYSPADGLIGEVAASRTQLLNHTTPCIPTTTPITRPTTPTNENANGNGKQPSALASQVEGTRLETATPPLQPTRLEILEVSLEALTHSHLRDRLMLTQLANSGLKVKWVMT